MLELRNITKEYKTGGEVVHALRGVSLAFRESEFVSILGPSGCGKTTMLNILGGLDQYTSGDLVIDDISTKEYKDADWDAYRNDTIGFVFQSYNLISHQTVLANVELALTLSGVSASERRKRAVRALEQVGLGDQINKKPAQMSGGQVQRVAIARALINDPDIILADEPTGALDSETSLQIMSILKDISTRKLVIMVTHNPELAETYSTRIVRLSDGQVISDSDPYLPGAAASAIAAASDEIASEQSAADNMFGTSGTASGTVPAAAASAIAGGTASAESLYSYTAPARGRRQRRRRNKSMSMRTALQLSLNNLMTKKARTLLTAFAGSIGIIGIALILSVSSGFQHYIDKLEEDTLSSYPLRIQSETADMSSMITAFAAGQDEDSDDEVAYDTIHEQQVMSEMLGSIGSNDLKAFKDYIEANIDTIGVWFNDYEYTYGISPTIYSTDLSHGPLRVSPGSILQSYMNGIQKSMVSYANTDVFFQMMDNQELLQSQFDVLAGEWPDEYDELLLVLDSPDQLNDYIVYTLGLRDPQELKDMINEVMKGNEVKVDNEPLEWTYDDFVGKEFALVNACDTYRKNNEYKVWEDMTDDDDFMEDLIKKSEKLHISGIVCPRDHSGANAMSMGIGYLPSLTHHMIDEAAESDIVKIQRTKKDNDVFSGKSFESIRNKTDEGLGFEDMISIDEGKLASALGGNFSQDAIRKSIMNNARKAMSDMDPSKMIKSIMTDVATGEGGIVKDLLSQKPDKNGMVPFDEAAVAKALKNNLNKGEHKAIVNKLLSSYADELNQKMADLEEGKTGLTDEELKDLMASMMAGQGTNPGGTSPGTGTGKTGKDSSAGKDAGTGTDTGSNPDAGTGNGQMSEEDLEKLKELAGLSGQDLSALQGAGVNQKAGMASAAGQDGADDASKDATDNASDSKDSNSDGSESGDVQDGGTDAAQVQSGSSDGSGTGDGSGADASGGSGDSSGGSGSEGSGTPSIPGLPDNLGGGDGSFAPVVPQMKFADNGKALLPILAMTLPDTVKENVSDEGVTNTVAAYAEGIALQKTAQNIPAAMAQVAADMGKQFNVDPAGIASAFSMKMSEEDLTRLITAYISGDEEASYEANLRKLGYADISKPSAMAFYLRDFESKEKFLDFIDAYNKDMQDRDKEDLVISYTDITGVLMKSVKTITNAVSYVLIAFVAISLVVSSIMIGVITYISVLERTKEIGILRAIGASKKDISRIFNAETIIVGLCAGVIGIGASLLLLIPINHILLNLTGIKALRAVLPAAGGAALILISIFLTFIAGLIPSGMAARKDPVVALRTE